MSSAKFPDDVSDNTKQFSQDFDDTIDATSNAPTEWAGAHAQYVFDELYAITSQLLRTGTGKISQDSGLTVKWSAFRAKLLNGSIVDVVAGTLTVDDNATNYVELSSSGTVTYNTSGFSLDAIPLAIVTAYGSLITSIEDKRVWLQATPDPNSSANSVGAILQDSSTIDFTYDPATPSITATIVPFSIDGTHIADGAITNSKIGSSAAIEWSKIDTANSKLSDIADVLGPATDSVLLVWNNANQTWEPTFIDDSSIAVNANIDWSKINKYGSHLHDVADMNAPSADGQILIWDGSINTWNPRYLNFDEINDVSVSSATTGDIISFDGTNWVSTNNIKADSTGISFFNNAIAPQQGPITHTSQTSASLTDNSGGTASSTIAAITDTNNAGSADLVPTKDAVASLADQVNKLISDMTNILAEIGNIKTALETYGLLAV